MKLMITVSDAIILHFLFLTKHLIRFKLSHISLIDQRAMLTFYKICLLTLNHDLIIIIITTSISLEFFIHHLLLLLTNQQCFRMISFIKLSFCSFEYLHTASLISFRS